MKYLLLIILPLFIGCGEVNINDKVDYDVYCDYVECYDTINYQEFIWWWPNDSDHYIICEWEDKIISFWKLNGSFCLNQKTIKIKE